MSRQQLCNFMQCVDLKTMGGAPPSPPISPCSSSCSPPPPSAPLASFPLVLHQFCFPSCWRERVLTWTFVNILEDVHYQWQTTFNVAMSINCVLVLLHFRSPPCWLEWLNMKLFSGWTKGKAWNKVGELEFFCICDLFDLDPNWELINVDVVVLIIFCFTKYQRKWKQKFVLLGKKVKVISSLV